MQIDIKHVFTQDQIDYNHSDGSDCENVEGSHNALRRLNLGLLRHNPGKHV